MADLVGAPYTTFFGFVVLRQGLHPTAILPQSLAAQTRAYTNMPH